MRQDSDMQRDLSSPSPERKTMAAVGYGVWAGGVQNDRMVSLGGGVWYRVRLAHSPGLLWRAKQWLLLFQEKSLVKTRCRCLKHGWFMYILCLHKLLWFIPNTILSTIFHMYIEWKNDLDVDRSHLSLQVMQKVCGSEGNFFLGRMYLYSKQYVIDGTPWKGYRNCG